ncbi:hypothetical protein JCM3774_005898 [Rhodotorula dairenensis]
MAPSSPRTGARPNRTNISSRISHLVARFEPNTVATGSEPLLPTGRETIRLDKRVQAEQAQIAGATPSEAFTAADEVPAHGSPATKRRTRNDETAEQEASTPDNAALTEEPQREDHDVTPLLSLEAVPSASPPASLAPIPESTASAPTLPRYRDIVYEDLAGPDQRGTCSTSHKAGNEDEKGDLGFSDPFDDVFAVQLDDLADPLLAHTCTLDRAPVSLAQDGPSVSPSPAVKHSVPLHRVFARDAEPLVLPGLDEAIDALGGAARFTPRPAIDSGRRFWDVSKRDSRQASRRESSGQETEAETPKRAVVDSTPNYSSEWVSWERWVREGPPPSRWSRFAGVLWPIRCAAPSDPLDDAAQDTGLTTAQYKRTLILPPFHLLPPGVTVTGLKANRRRPAPLVTLQSVLKTLGNGILGAAGSSKGISLTTIEGLRDLMQLATLLTSASGSPVATPLHATEPPSGALRTIFVTMPAFLSLDLVSAFGKALIFLFVLTLVTLAALYELMRFTGGWKGPSSGLQGTKLDQGEGYDREGTATRQESWRNSRVWRIVVTFWCTSVYLPLSKWAIGALVYTDDYWPVPNPYLATRDTKPDLLASLGAAQEFHDPLDFCYRTSMRRNSINFTFVLLPVAALVILTLSLWLPWRLRSIINHQKPKVDAWTELGERRRNLNAEYQRLLDADPSPFSFLYRDFRRPWATFRSVYLVFKLLNVFIVVVIQKNNCVFRHYSTTYLSVIRQGCLLAFLSLYSLFAMRTLPYLDIPSNSSDVCSRVGYSLLAMLGLLAALGFCKTDPAQLAVNIVLYTLSLYFVLIGTSWAQNLVKKAQRRLDFSIDIFSPSLDVNKHVNRRIWQETLATLFLCSPEFAMPAHQPLVFSEETPPYLLGFSGSAAERLVENLKILRTLGLPAYQDAVARLSDPRLNKLRETISHDVNRSAVSLPEHRFSPHYFTSICYHPMRRKDLEAFLADSGLAAGRRSFFHPGLLNRIYLYLDTLLLSDASRVVRLHFSDETTQRLSRLAARLGSVHRAEAQEKRDQGSRFTVSTGAGTDENDGEIRQRLAFLWEEAVVEPRPPMRDFTKLLRWLATVHVPHKMAVFFGLSPLVKDWYPRKQQELLIDLADNEGEEGEESMQCR